MLQDEKIINIIKDLLKSGVDEQDILSFMRNEGDEDLVYEKICVENGTTSEEINSIINGSSETIKILITAAKDNMKEIDEEIEVSKEDKIKTLIKNFATTNNYGTIKSILMYGGEAFNDKESKKIIQEALEEQGISEEELLEFFGEDEEKVDEMIKENTELANEIEEQQLEEEKSNKDELSRYSDKAKKLLKKAEELKSKLDNEDLSLFNKHRIALKLKLLLTKIQREIDIQNKKEEFEAKREEIDAKANEKESDYEAAIERTRQQIKRVQRMLNGNKEYDYESPTFLYPQSHVERKGGIEGLTKSLKASKKPESVLAATKIEQVNKKKQELEKLQKEYEKQYAILDNIDKKKEHDKIKINKEEKSVILSKNNIFIRIKDFFKDVSDQINEYFAEVKQTREAKKNKEKEKAIKEAYEKDIEESNKLYDARINELLEQMKKLQEEHENDIKSREEQKENDIKLAKEQQENEIKQLQQQNRSNMIKDFQERISNMKNYYQEDSISNVETQDNSEEIDNSDQDVAQEDDFVQ